MNIVKIWHYIFSPKLHKVYGGPVEQVYEPNSLEKLGDQVVTLLNILWNCTVYTSPFIGCFMYRRGYFIQENMVVFSKCVTTIGVIYVMSLILRGLGRVNSEIYQTFYQALRNAQISMSPENKKVLSKYDFDFSAWPVEFKFSEVQSVVNKTRITIGRSSSQHGMLHWLTMLPCKILGTVAVHSFGLRIIYPGSLGILQTMLSSALLQGRAKLVESYEAQRFKLKTRDSNELDTMFLDRRETKSNNSRILVICCEGNAGFYEIGIMNTPTNAGYSVLGWNHPGFAWSTGRPYPEQEQNAIETVVEFAINKLGFEEEDIVLFGWSIGGYVSSWAAMNYPNIRGVILDATFDDIMPLAIQHMPTWWESVVRMAIRDHVNLNNFEQLKRYPGPVLLIRRTEDEVICTIENDLSSNRGNYMLLKLMQYRYPLIFGNNNLDIVKSYLNDTSSEPVTKYQVDNQLCSSIIQSYISENSKSYPMKIGEDVDPDIKMQLALFLVQKYMRDFKSTHCTPLPSDMFQMPWDISVDNDYVFT